VNLDPAGSSEFPQAKRVFGAHSGTSVMRGAGWWALALLLAVGAVLLINPIGYIGGGLDDWQYLNAARCWREFGPCLPHDHWQARWPVIAPIAAFTALFGESRATVGAMPLLESTACLLLIAAIGNRMFGRPVGWIAALLMLATPVFAIQLLQPSVEAVELAWLLAGFLTLLFWDERRKWHLAFLAGLCFSMAIQVRETAAVGALLAFAYVLTRTERPGVRDLLFAASGFLLPFAIEFLLFWSSTSDPFWRRRLDLQHTLIASSELKTAPDPNHGPLLNKSYIANWKPAAGIHVHWTVDGILNLLASGQSGLSLLLTPLLALIARGEGDGAAKTAARLWLLALGYACVLIYVLAVDPKPRMMFAPFAMTNVALALLCCRLFRRSRAIVIVSCLTSASLCAVLLYAYPSDLMMERSAKAWIAAHPGQIEIDGNTRRHLALVPAAAALPGLDARRPYLLYRSAEPCEQWVRRNGQPGQFTVAAEAAATRVAWVEERLGPLCLLHYDRPRGAKRLSYRAME
jgi:4-amino-4-deoxy-L-arabinose transferase-like glycosyltransferase